MIAALQGRFGRALAQPNHRRDGGAVVILLQYQAVRNEKSERYPMRLIHLVAMAIFMMPTAATAKTVEVLVSAFASEGAPSDYALVAEKGFDAESLEFRSYAAKLDKMMAARGWTRAADAGTAKVTIMVSYGIGDPKDHQYSYSIAQYNGAGQPNTWLPINGEYVSYRRWLKMSTMRSTPDGGKPQEIWRVDVESSGSSGDIRAIFPYLVYAAAPYIGADTGQAVRVKVKDNNKDFRAFNETARVDPRR
ncbi:hypothetical protein G4G27_15230 [Sphingomonas sp. So64.6b]|uniref:hypothetical protein n=1 Tax=Sphingomonas sp. So64.6b TaxID=2997354 RepID=UPI001602102C|nr:hypothetical protein [Sphingomonas sp. So64.6b]QNA85201.1 hypothetical protein G4G27_15230 [Sphingomonas sp. So64.6b]